MWKKGAVLLYAKQYRTADTHQKMVLLMFWLQSISFTLSFASNTAIQHLCNIRASKTYTLTENWCSPSLKTKKKKKTNKTQPQVTPKPQNNSPLLHVVFCWTNKIILLASWSHREQIESRDKHTTREPERKTILRNFTLVQTHIC